MKTEWTNEPQCMIMTSCKISKNNVNLLVSGSDVNFIAIYIIHNSAMCIRILIRFFYTILQLRMTVWDNDRCIRTTMGVNLESPVKKMKVNKII